MQGGWAGLGWDGMGWDGITENGPIIPEGPEFHGPVRPDGSWCACGAAKGPKGHHRLLYSVLRRGHGVRGAGAGAGAADAAESTEYKMVTTTTTTTMMIIYTLYALVLCIQHDPVHLQHHPGRVGRHELPNIRQVRSTKYSVLSTHGRRLLSRAPTALCIYSARVYTPVHRPSGTDMLARWTADR